jgi:hypothetical protein
MERLMLEKKIEIIFKPILLGVLILIFLGVITEIVNYSNSAWKTRFSTPGYSGIALAYSQDEFLLCIPEKIDSQNRGYKLVKTDKFSNIQWSKSYHKNDWGYSISSISPTGENGFILCGEASSEELNSVLYICKIDSDGIEEWHKIYGSKSSKCVGIDIVARDDSNPFRGGFFAVGKCGNTSGSYSNIYLVRIFEDGGAFWNKEIENEDNVKVKAVCYQDNHIIITGTCESESEDVSDIWVSKHNHLGNVVWETKIDGPEEDTGSDIVSTSGGFLTIAGSTQSWGKGGSSYIAVKVNSNGGEVWRRIYDSSSFDECNSIITTSDGGYLLVGKSGWNIMIIKTDSRGNEKWRRIFGGLYTWEEGYWAFETEPGRFIIGGTSSFAEKFLSIVLIELNEESIPTSSLFFWLGWLVKITVIIPILLISMRARVR